MSGLGLKDVLGKLDHFARQLGRRNVLEILGGVPDLAAGAARRAGYCRASAAASRAHPWAVPSPGGAASGDAGNSGRTAAAVPDKTAASRTDHRETGSCGKTSRAPRHFGHMLAGTLASSSWFQRP